MIQNLWLKQYLEEIVGNWYCLVYFLQKSTGLHRVYWEGRGIPGELLWYPLVLIPFFFASTVSVKLMNCDKLNNIAPIIIPKSEPYTDIPSCNIITCESASLTYDFEICDIIEIDTNISSYIIMVVLKFVIHTYFCFELSLKKSMEWR